MLKKSYRLSTKEFMEVMEKGRIYTSPILIMRVFQYREQGKKIHIHARIAAVAPKKVAPTAVMRNFLRRRIYQAVQPLITSIIPGTHAIILAKRETIPASVSDISTDIKTLFAKAKIGV